MALRSAFARLMGDSISRLIGWLRRLLLDMVGRSSGVIFIGPGCIISVVLWKGSVWGVLVTFGQYLPLVPSRVGRDWNHTTKGISSMNDSLTTFFVGRQLLSRPHIPF
jgi:hypothetical protein